MACMWFQIATDFNTLFFYPGYHNAAAAPVPLFLLFSIQREKETEGGEIMSNKCPFIIVLRCEFLMIASFIYHYTTGLFDFQMPRRTFCGDNFSTLPVPIQCVLIAQ